MEIKKCPKCGEKLSIDIWEKVIFFICVNCGYKEEKNEEKAS